MTYRYTPTDPFDITTHHFMVLMFNEIVLFYDSLAFHKEVVLIKSCRNRLTAERTPDSSTRHKTVR